MEDEENEKAPVCERSPYIVYLRPGQECPNCHFAKLEIDENRELECPVCGYGTNRPYT